jgi:hypothetical protein
MTAFVFKFDSKLHFFKTLVTYRRKSTPSVSHGFFNTFLLKYAKELKIKELGLIKYCISSF